MIHVERQVATGVASSASFRLEFGHRKQKTVDENTVLDFKDLK
jgi:hypothetical protein